jgi:hypothetical protein
LLCILIKQNQRISLISIYRFNSSISSADTNGPIWDKGKTGPLSQYANHVLRDEPRRVFDVNEQ